MAGSTKETQGLALMAIGGLVIAGTLLLFVWRLGDRVEAGVVERCQIKQGNRQRAYGVVTTEDVARFRSFKSSTRPASAWRLALASRSAATSSTSA
ncbi:MAG TPA: hypothetical protein VK509_17565 [Polyangiales bacterium]|nr:hypothetical protein [Polyangiales bacterium]